MKKFFIAASIMLAIILIAFSNTTGVQITGKIVDVAGKAIPGASILVKNLNIVTTSNANGEFTVTVPDKKAVLIVSLVGFIAQEIKVDGPVNLLIKLQPAKQLLDEVVVTGYGTGLKTLSPQVRGTAAMFTPPYLQKSFQYEPKRYYNIKDKSEAWRYNNNFSREGYDRIVESPFLAATENPLSTFSIDVDAASFSNIRRMLDNNQLPPAGSVRIEEMINYFSYQYPQPKAKDPFSINTEMVECPWNEEHKLLSIGLQGKIIPVTGLAASNLTFLIDVSGSMNQEDKLPLVKASLKLLVDQLREQDKVSIVVYAGSAGLVLSPTYGSNTTRIKDAINNLEAGGSTAGGQGIKLAYATAKSNFISKGNNRVILCTDGDFNVGVSSDDELERLIEEERKSGVYLTVLGFGTGNYQDAKMQKLADKGNGNHAYIDQLSEAKKVLVSEFGGTLFTIAKDVKLQLEFNPAKVQGYRLIGYENRMLAKEDFNDDKKDAGELGSGHTVTALYEIIPVGVRAPEIKTVDDLRYKQETQIQSNKSFSDEWVTIKLRYKEPTSDVSKLLQVAITDEQRAIEKASENVRFSAAVAQFGMLLRNSEFKGKGGYKLVEQLASNALTNDAEGYRKEFLELVKKAAQLSKDVARKE